MVEIIGGLPAMMAGSAPKSISAAGQEPSDAGAYAEEVAGPS
jgi:hypothetical protein